MIRCTGCEQRCEAGEAGTNPPCFVPDFRDYFRELGRKGGQASGARKRRGDSEYYRALSKKRTDHS